MKWIEREKGLGAMNRACIWPVIGVVLFPLAQACGSGPTSPSDTPRVIGVSVQGQTPAVGETSPFKALAMLDSNLSVDVTDAAEWSSTNQSVATVSAGGLVRAVGPGLAEIVATYRAVGGRATLTVLDERLTAFDRDYLAAILLGTGPLVPSDGVTGCPAFRVWSGFPSGTTVRVRISTNVPAAHRVAIEEAVDLVGTVTLGNVTAVSELTEEANPLPLSNETTVAVHASPSSQGCANDVGCTMFRFSPADFGVVRSGRVVMPPNQVSRAYVHDVLGHALLGLCHVDANAIGGSQRSLMSANPGGLPTDIAPTVTSLDVAAIQHAYQAGLRPGTLLPTFQSRGLINPQTVLPNSTWLVAGVPPKPPSSASKSPPVRHR